MIICVVSDVLGEANNGTTIAAFNLINSLKKAGHDVRIVSPDSEKAGQINYYIVPTYTFGPLDFIVEANGVRLARGDSLVLMRAMTEADLVHVVTPLSLGRKAMKVATYLGKPITASFHMQAENVTAHFFNFQNIKWINNLVYHDFYNHVFRYADAIHYPTQFIRDTFEKAIGKTTPGHVISNGVNKEFHRHDIEKPANLKGKFLIYCTGRYSKEKNQQLLIRAAAASRYAEKIQIVFAGSGPRLKGLQALSAKLLPNPAIFRFFSRAELVDALSIGDLYVHTSSVEIEAISCLEAIACGLVPVINNARRSATRYFGLHENNLFKEDDYRDLARKIDYWIDHPKEKEECAKEYAGYSKQFDFDTCMHQMVSLLEETSKIKKEPRHGK